MNKKVIWILAAVALLLAALVVGMLWFVNNYAVVDMQFYPRDAQVLDLREQEISQEHFDKLHRKLPDCQIRWNVMFQNALCDSASTELTVEQLTDADVRLLKYFPKLKTLDAGNCEDYSQLMAARAAYPELAIIYNVTLGGEKYPQDAKTVELSAVTQEEIARLACLTELDTVIAKAGIGENSVALQNYCRENGLAFCVSVGNAILSEETEEARIEGASEAELELLSLLPRLTRVHLMEPAAPAEAVFAFRDKNADMTVTWEKTVSGFLCDMKTEEVDYTDLTVTSIEEVEQGLAYFPNVKHVFLGEPGIDNEKIAAFRERNRENYKVVWVVDLSGKMKVRTDIDNFMPSRDGWGYVRDGEIDNIRYCEEIMCMDIGHMGVKDVSFLETLTNLEYLILAHTEVQYIDAIRNCKKLKFLELDWSCIRDLSPLVECTALEDLNIGKTWPDITPVLQMTWLKNLYMIMGRGADAYRASQALPNTRVVASGTATVASGWRNLPNYYAMRDALGMFYMSAGY